jgi:hypothetical protein
VEDQPLNNTAFEVGDKTTNERSGSLDNNGPALGGNPSGSPGEHALYPLLWKQPTSFSNIA